MNSSSVDFFFCDAVSSVLEHLQRNERDEHTPAPYYSSLFSQLVVLYFALTIPYQYLYSKYFSALRAIPRAGPDWPFQLCPWIVQERNPPELLQWARETPNTGLIRYRGLGGAQRLVATTHEAMREIIGSQSYTSFIRMPKISKRYEYILGRGLVWAEGDVHKRQKSKLLPLFNVRTVKALYPHFWQKSTEMTRLIHECILRTQDSGVKESSSATVDLGEWISRASLDSIGVAAWGSDFEALQNPYSAFYSVYHKQFRGTKYDQLLSEASLFLPQSWLKFLPTKRVSNVTDATEAARQISRDAVKREHIIHREGDASKQSNSILSGAMRSRAFDDGELVEQLVTILAAGHETTSIAAFWCCFLLCKHLRVQERLRDEIRSNIPPPNSDRPIDLTVLESLPYLQAVINEVLRFKSILRNQERLAVKDTIVCGQLIPRGTVVYASPYLLHRLESVWGPDADVFDPDRWLRVEDTATQRRAKFSNLMAFSVGPKSCIGQGFVRAELYALITAVVGKFELALERPDVEPDIVWTVTAKPLGKTMFKITVVDGW